MAEWDEVQYIVPANVTPMGTHSRSLCVPDDTDWIATVTGAIRSLIVPSNWSDTLENGDEADVDAAVATAYQMYLTWVFQTCAGGSMSCEDVADCIESNEAVAAALLQNLLAQGFTPNPDSTTLPQPITISASDSAANLVSGLTDCSNPSTDMAIARAVVNQLNEATIDAFDVLELYTNSIEAGKFLAQNVPVFGTALASMAEFADWFLQSVVEAYQAAWTQTAEDDLSCAVFCKLQDGCSLSLDDLLSVYETEASLTVPTIETIDDMINFMLTTAITIDTVGVAVFHYHILKLLQFGGKVFGLGGFNALRQAMEIASTYIDTTWQNCDCAPSETPTDYFMLYQDCRNGAGDMTLFRGTQTTDGIRSATNGSLNNVQIRIADLGAAYQFKAAAIEVQRRGSTGNGNDFNTVRGNTLANFAGVEHVVMNEGFITDNTNNDYSGQIQVTPTTACRSIFFAATDNAVLNYPTNFCTLVKVVAYGLCNAGQVKPAQAVYVTSIPTDVLELFPT